MHCRRLGRCGDSSIKGEGWKPNVNSAVKTMRLEKEPAFIPNKKTENVRVKNRNAIDSFNPKATSIYITKSKRFAPTKSRSIRLISLLSGRYNPKDPIKLVARFRRDICAFNGNPCRNRVSFLPSPEHVPHQISAVTFIIHTRSP